MPSSEDVKKSETLDYPTDGQSNADRIFDEFCADRESIAALGVTGEEFRELSRASLLGTLTSKDDLLFILRQIRAAMNPGGVPPPTEQATPGVNKMAEKMRLAALEKLNELDLKAAKRRESAIGRIEAACGRLMMVLNLARSVIAQVSHKLNRGSFSSRSV
jgi:hypothetical protein